MNSIVDYLNQKGQASDFNSRTALATQNGIANYTGTAEQNTQLLGILQKPVVAPVINTQGGVGTASYGSTPVISSGTIGGNPQPYNLPAPVDNTSKTNAALNVATAQVNNNNTPVDYGLPIQGAPTVPYITVNGKNYASDPSQRTYNSAGGTTTTSTPQTTTTSQDMSTSGGIKNRLLELLGIQATKGTETTAAQTQYGVDTKNQALVDLQNQAITLDKSYQDQIDNIRQNNPGGMLTGAQNATIAQLQKDQTRAKSDNAIQQLVAQNNLNGALNMAKLKIDAEFQPVQDQIDTLKTYFDIVQNDMTESEKLKAQQQITQQTNDMNDLKTAKKDATDALVKAGLYTQEKADIINNATTPEQASMALVGLPATTSSGNTKVQYTDPRSLSVELRNSLMDDIVLNKGNLDQLYAA